MCISSLTAFHAGQTFCAMPEDFSDYGSPGSDSPLPSVIQFLLQLHFAAISVVFCIALHLSEHTYKKYIANPYLRVFVGGLIVVLLTLLLHTNDYNGAGMPMIARCFEGSVPPWAFMMKISFYSSYPGCRI